MRNLIGLEAKKNNLRPYFLGVFGIFLAVVAMGLLFCAVPVLEPNDAAAQEFANPSVIITMISIISMSAFAILASVMHAKFVVEEYTGRKNVLLFTYPQKRSTILLAKILLIFGFTFVMMFVVTMVSCFAVGFIANGIGLIAQPFADVRFMVTYSIIFSFVANFIGLISLKIGFYKKSVIVPIVVSTILVSPFGNAVMLLGTNTKVAFIMAGGVLLLVSVVLFIGLLKKVNKMECV